MPQRRFVGAELLHLVLREVAERERLRGVPRAGKRRQRAGDRFQQRRLAGAVGAEESDALAVEEAPVEAFEHRRTARIAQRHLLELHEPLRSGRHRRERELERAVGMRSRDLLHPLERLDAALRLLRLGGFGAEAVDERLQVRDLPLLLHVRRLLQRELLRALALELRIVAGVGLELPRVEMDDAADHAVEEIAVVGDEEQRSGITREPVLEPQHCVEVEVIGRLVEEQEVRAAHQRLREVEPHPPAAGESRDRIPMARRREAEAGQEHCRAGTRRIAADLVVAVMEVRERFALAGRIGARCGLGDLEGTLDLAQLAVAVLDEVDRRRGGRQRLLRDVRRRPRRRKLDVPGVLVRLPQDQREEARLAAAVRPDEADLVSRMHGEVRPVEQALRAAGEGEVGDAEHVTSASSRSRSRAEHGRRSAGSCRSRPPSPWPRCRVLRSGSRSASRRSSPRPRPRFDHHVYRSGRGSRRRNTSTKPRSSNTRVSHARSSGRKPEFFRLLRQFLRSISRCAMFQSPQRTISRFCFRSFARCGRNASRKRNFDACRCGPLEPEGRYTLMTVSAAKWASR